PNKHTVQCSINYIDDKPVYQVAFGNDFCNQVISYKSSSNAAALYHQQINPEIKTQTSGILLFGLQLECLRQNRKKQYEKNILNPIDDISNSALTKRAKNVGKMMFNNFTSVSKRYYNRIDKPILEELRFSLDGIGVKDEHKNWPQLDADEIAN
ncbi:5253_t:CDS:2, partial [Cetraspora pellucida]